MTEEEIVRDRLQGMAKWIKAQLPSRDWGFILLAFPFGPGGNLMYVANAHRDDVIQSMREFIAKNRENPKTFTDQGDTGSDAAFDQWWKKEISRIERIDGQDPAPWVRQLAFDAFIAGMVWSVA